jgi:hypothetical protein
MVALFQFVKLKEYSLRLKVQNYQELIKLPPQVPTKIDISDNSDWLICPFSLAFTS